MVGLNPRKIMQENPPMKTRHLALALVLLAGFLTAGCGTTSQYGSEGIIQGEEVGAGSHTSLPEVEGGASHRHHGAGHYNH